MQEHGGRHGAEVADATVHDEPSHEVPAAGALSEELHRTRPRNVSCRGLQAVWTVPRCLSHVVSLCSLPHTFITWEVAEACCGCMLAQADDAERRDMLPAAQERIILEEFGRCLGQIVESACKAQPLPSYAPGATVALPGAGHGGSGLGLHRGTPVGMTELEVSHSTRLSHHGGSSGGDENVIVDV